MGVPAARPAWLGAVAVDTAGQRPDGGGASERGLPARSWGGRRLRVPVVMRDDRLPEPVDGYAPNFRPGSERPVTGVDEVCFATVPGAWVVLSCRVPGTLSWLDAWRSPVRCTATVTDGRVVFGCRLYREQPGHPHGGKVLGGQLRYETVNRVGIWISPGSGDSHLLLYASDEWRQWRLAIGTPDLTREGSALAEEIAVAVARRHLAIGQPDPDVAGQLWACVDGVRLRPTRGHGVTVTLPGELPMAVPGGELSG